MLTYNDVQPLLKPIDVLKSVGDTLTYNTMFENYPDKIRSLTYLDVLSPAWDLTWQATMLDFAYNAGKFVDTGKLDSSLGLSKRVGVGLSKIYSPLLYKKSALAGVSDVFSLGLVKNVTDTIATSFGLSGGLRDVVSTVASGVSYGMMRKVGGVTGIADKLLQIETVQRNDFLKEKLTSLKTNIIDNVEGKVIGKATKSPKPWVDLSKFMTDTKSAGVMTTIGRKVTRYALPVITGLSLGVDATRAVVSGVSQFTNSLARFQNNLEDIRQMRRSGYRFGSGKVVSSTAIVSERQRMLNAINNSQLNVRDHIGDEARYMSSVY